MNGGSRPELKLVLTFTAKGDVQTRRLRQELAELGLPVAKSEIRRLNAFRDACDSSVTRQKSREAREAAKDLEALFQELVLLRLEASVAAGRLKQKEVANG